MSDGESGLRKSLAIGGRFDFTNTCWFLSVYFVIEVGEMLLSPMGLTCSGTLAAQLGRSAIEAPAGELLNIADALARHDVPLAFSAWIRNASGVVELVWTA